MPEVAQLLIAAHVIGDVVWIGSISAVALILGQPKLDAKVRGEVGLAIYRRLANPAFALALVAGLVQLLMHTQHYFVATKYMHAKLLVALLVIGLHHVIGGRARRMASGERADAGPAPKLGWVLIGLAAVATTLAVTKPF